MQNGDIITILGEPMGKQRPKATSINGHTTVYTPKKTINYEVLVKMEYHRQSGKFYSNDKQLLVTIMCYFSIPKSFSKKKVNACLNGEIAPMTKPDVDNIAKIIMDALNGVAYADDKQVTQLYIVKKYAQEPQVQFIITEL